MQLDSLNMPRSYCHRTLSVKMYRGIVEPHLRYCCSVWGACGGTRLQVLQKLQNRAARIVTNSSYDSSASALIKTLNWPTVADMRKVETACMGLAWFTNQ